MRENFGDQWSQVLHAITDAARHRGRPPAPVHCWAKQVAVEGARGVTQSVGICSSSEPPGASRPETQPAATAPLKAVAIWP
jgi:hypothetical protein